MNTNIRITLTDAQRNVLKRRLTGKDTKAMISRAELNELVQGYVNELLLYKPIQKPLLEAEYRGADYGDDEPDQGDVDFCSDDCCRRNELLQRRVNILQHRLDTR